MSRDATGVCAVRYLFPAGQVLVSAAADAVTMTGACMCSLSLFLLSFMTFLLLFTECVLLYVIPSLCFCMSFLHKCMLYVLFHVMRLITSFTHPQQVVIKFICHVWGSIRACCCICEVFGTAFLIIHQTQAAFVYR